MPYIGVDAMESPRRTSAHVAPLQITKCKTRTSASSNLSRQSLQSQNRVQSTLSEEDSRPLLQQNQFHNYLRATYSFCPDQEETVATSMLQLHKGEIILVHQKTAEGWVDGTLLSTGARGWLPSNYCQPFDQEPIGVLMRALTQFWDLTKGDSRGSMVLAHNQDYVRGLVSGVRWLLVSTESTVEWAGMDMFPNTNIGQDKLPH